MRRGFIIMLIGLGLLLVSGPALRSAATDPEAAINHAREIVMTPNPPEHGLTQALVEVLGASLAILPQVDHAAEFRSLVEAAKKAFGEGALFSDKAYQGLGEAYKLVSGGRAWQVPAELRTPGHGSIEAAKRACVKLLDSALAEHKAGQNIEAARDLIGFVILVVTPIER